MITRIVLANIFLWVPLSFYVISRIPLILKNYRLQSTTGLSYYLIFLWHLGITTCWLYVHFLQLPLAYQVLCPIQWVVQSVLAFQAVLYAPTKKIQRIIAVAHGSIVIGLGIAGVVATFNPIATGYFFGWATTVVYGISQIPQIVKMWFRKTTAGFSIWFLIFAVMAVIIDFLCGIALDVPLPTIVCASRRVAGYCIMLLQFYLYRHNKSEKIDTTSKWYPLLSKIIQ